jgi:hypothetical protein
MGYGIAVGRTTRGIHARIRVRDSRDHNCSDRSLSNGMHGDDAYGELDHIRLFDFGRCEQRCTAHGRMLDTHRCATLGLVWLGILEGRRRRPLFVTARLRDRRRRHGSLEHSIHVSRQHEPELGDRSFNRLRRRHLSKVTRTDNGPGQGQRERRSLGLLPTDEKPMGRWEEIRQVRRRPLHIGVAAQSDAQHVTELPGEAS